MLALGTAIATNPFSTTTDNQLLLAFVSAADYLGHTTVASVSGGGLTWEPVARTDVQPGSSEIWRAFAGSPLTSTSVTVTLTNAAPASVTVVSFSGVDTSGVNGSGAIGAVSSGNGTGAPTAALTTTHDHSWVFGVGNDPDTPTARVIALDQTMVHEFLAPIGQSFWVQRATAPIDLAGTAVTIADIAPATDRYNMTLVEIPAAFGDPASPLVAITDPIDGSSSNSMASISGPRTQRARTPSIGTAPPRQTESTASLPRRGTQAATPARRSSTSTSATPLATPRRRLCR